MTLKSGFFNSVNNDRLYDAVDFTTYLAGLIVNGCLPNDTGFLVSANPEPIGANPPSVIIGVGKAYYDGFWVYNDTSFVYSLGTGQQVVSGIHYLIYLKFDISEAGRTVSIGKVTGTSPIIPADTSTSFYMPLALVADRMNVQPGAGDIQDTRWYAGVQGIGIVTQSLTDKCVTIEKLDEYIVNASGKFILPLVDGLVKNANIPDNEIGLSKFADMTILNEVAMHISDPVQAEEEIGTGTTRISYVATANSRMKVDVILTLDCSLITSPTTCTFRLKYREKVGTVWGAFVEMIWYVNSVNGDDIFIPVPLIGIFDMTAGNTYEVCITGASNGTTVVVSRVRMFGSISPR